MSQTERRIRELLVDQLDLEGVAGEDLDSDRLEELGLNSLAAVAFLKVLSKEFGVDIPMSEAQKFTTVEDLVAYIEVNAG